MINFNKVINKSILGLTIIVILTLIFSTCNSPAGNNSDQHTHVWSTWMPPASYLEAVESTRICNCGKSETIIGPHPIANTADWNTAREEIASGKGSIGTFVLTVTEDFTAPASNFGITPNGNTLSIIITGNKTITLRGTGNLIYVGTNQNITINNLILKGYGANNVSLVQTAGTNTRFTMQGSSSVSGNTIDGNDTGLGGGVNIGYSGTFIMQDNASVSGNTIKSNNYSAGGGVFVSNSGIFTMQDNAMVSGNSITSNSSGNGGGVHINNDGLLTMQDNAMVSGNIITTNGSSNGGGVHIHHYANFNMKGGTISGNTVIGNNYGYGGGLSLVQYSNFRMANGTVYGNDVSAPHTNTSNTAGAALFLNYVNSAQYGKFNGDTWVPAGSPGPNLNTRNNTIKVINGVLQS